MKWINREQSEKAYLRLAVALNNGNNDDGIEAILHLLTFVMLKHLASLELLGQLLSAAEHFDWVTPVIGARIQSEYTCLMRTTLNTYDLLKTSTPFCSTSPSILEVLDYLREPSTGVETKFGRIDQ